MELLEEDKNSEVGKSSGSEGNRSHHRERPPPQRHPKLSPRDTGHPDSFSSDGRIVNLTEPANGESYDYEGCDAGQGLRCRNGSILRFRHSGQP